MQGTISVIAVWAAVGAGAACAGEEPGRQAAATAARSGGTASPPAPQPALPKEINLDLCEKVGMKLMLIPAGKFTMGSPADEADSRDDERPRREVTISRPFYMGATEVTQAQWKAVMGTTLAQVQQKLAKPWPLRGEGPELPMYLVTWEQAVEFCKKASEKCGRTMRLPTEAEWEYACRAGTDTVYPFGDDKAALGQYAWTRQNSKDRNEAHLVATRKPNPWGLYDMMGNVWEWCHDWYAKDYYALRENVDPQGPATGKRHVLRGGAWFSYALPRSAKRQCDDRQDRWGWGVGFRVVAEAP